MNADSYIAGMILFFLVHQQSGIMLLCTHAECVIRSFGCVRKLEETDWSLGARSRRLTRSRLRCTGRLPDNGLGRSGDDACGRDDNSVSSSWPEIYRPRGHISGVYVCNMYVLGRIIRSDLITKNIVWYNKDKINSLDVIKV